MSFAAGALALLPVGLLGALLQRVLGIRRPGIEGFPADMAAGVALLAVLGTTMTLLDRLSVWPIYVLLAALAAQATAVSPWAAAGQNGTTTETRSRGWSRGGYAAAVLLVLLVLLVTAFGDRLVWDGWAIWTLRARVLFLEGGLPSIVYEKPGPLDFAHPEYPLGVPLLDWWLYRHAGAPAPALAGLAGWVWLAALVGLLWTALRRTGAAPAAGLAALALVLFRPISQGALGGTADVVMSLAVLGAAVELRAAWEREAGDSRNGSAAPWLRAMLYLLLGALAKNEGAALAVAACGGVLLAGALRRRRPPFAAAVLLLPVLAAGAWQLHVRSMGLGVEQIGSLSAAGGLGERAVVIAGALGGLALHRSWPPVAALVLLGGWAMIRRRLAPEPAHWLVLGYFAATMVVYLSTSQPLDWLLATSLGRVMTHLVPAAVYLALVAVAPRPAPRC